MTDLSINKVSGEGMNFERQRVEMAMLRLSLIDVSFSTPTEASAFAKNAQSKFHSELFADQLQASVSTKAIKEPSNPKADSEGNVFYLDIDPTKEMATLVAATRAYEANVKAYNINSQMVRTALDIGNR